MHTLRTISTGLLGGMPYAVCLGWEFSDWREAAGLAMPVSAAAAALLSASDLASQSQYGQYGLLGLGIDLNPKGHTSTYGGLYISIPPGNPPDITTDLSSEGVNRVSIWSLEASLANGYPIEKCLLLGIGKRWTVMRATTFLPPDHATPTPMSNQIGC
jgi:hypothetical protein